MDAAGKTFLKRCLLFDIEVNEKKIVYSLGGVLGENSFQSPDGAPVNMAMLDKFSTFGKEADYLVGHNILDHDIPKLKEIAPHLEVLQKPVIDTLYLSPLAFPANPYHRLVKNYQLVRDSINDPVKDARLAGKVFSEQWDSFASQLTSGEKTPLFYRGFLESSGNLATLADGLEAIGVPLLADNDLLEDFALFAKKRACATAVDDLLERWERGSIEGVILAYVAAWLSVAGTNSVLPPWVRHRFPQISGVLHGLREVQCSEGSCRYCTTHHDPRYFLQRYFEFEDFRPSPATEDGRSLQAEVVTAGARSMTLFATLPTGGGKSLCYMLPGIMRYVRRNLLTIVISPLQALMKDQVDNFSKQTGTRIATALYGMLTMPERGEIQEGIRLGDVGILYVSPEQLRNHSFINAVKQREIGAWIFDEAHCLSKWGHDFRPDYFYAIRFIREFAGKNNSKIPPVQCFTATAKRDVRAEITDTIQSELGLKVHQFEGGHERTNLHYDVYSVDQYEKRVAILELLRTRFTDGGCVVIYCATRDNTEQLAEFLQDSGYETEAFHAGLDSSLKKRIQEQFINGEIPIICATNAFGMGIDKDDVRLVIHADIPGSLENYLQEAGRAGRDRNEAECILVYDEQDIENQFRLSSMSRLTKRDISQMLRGIKNASRGREELVITAGELLRNRNVDIDTEKFNDPDTRVRTAVSWLERAGFLERNENNTRVFQGKPLVRNLEEAQTKILSLDLSKRQQQRWLAIVAALMENQENASFSVDELATLSAFSTAEDDKAYETENRRVLATLQDMEEQGLLSKETGLTAYLRYKVKDNARYHLQKLNDLEAELIKIMEEVAPDADSRETQHLDLRQVNQKLHNTGYTYSTPDVLRCILHSLRRDGKGLKEQQGTIRLQAKGSNAFSFVLKQDWTSLKHIIGMRQLAVQNSLSVILSTIAATEKPNASLLVEFTMEQIVDGLKKDLVLFPHLKRPITVAERALTYMHELGVIDLQQGLAIFNQAMTLSLKAEARKRRYSAADFLPLKTHYDERNFQIHVMNAYAQKAIEKIGSALRFVSSYFNDEKVEFVNRYFPNREEVLERATSEQSYGRIVEDLKNNAQIAIVSGGMESNMLVLAGPGAGKTRVVTHRVAYLLRVKRVNPRNILVLCFNRSAVMSLRRRIRELVGYEMRGVTTLTFHGLALRLTGRSLAVANGEKDGKEIDFKGILQEAIALLKGDSEVLGYERDSAWERIIGRFSHILVDEYQDIDEEQYQLISLLAGKQKKESEQKLTIMAVGDDDQNIYQFRGANIGFIRRFHKDYTAEKHYLIENYRSSGNIISASNCLIANNRDRMKTDHPIEINRARRQLPPGGNWQRIDRLVQGRVAIIDVDSVQSQSQVVLEEIQRMRGLEGSFDLNQCAVLAREWKELDQIRSIFEGHGMPVNLNWGREKGFPTLRRIRENASLLAYLKNVRTEVRTGSSLLKFLPSDPERDNFWQANLRRLLVAWIEETHDAEQPVTQIEDYLYEALLDQGRSRNLGNGVFLSTVHSVKGLEFDHVFMLGENWQEKNGSEMEEARRLYYVGMSRARETLHLIRVQGMENPHTSVVTGDYVHHRVFSPSRKDVLFNTRTREVKRYTLLGLQDLYLDYAGLKNEGNPIRRSLELLQPGDRLGLVIRNGHIELVNQRGIAVSRLSKTARDKWKPYLGMVQEVRVVAVVTRNIEDIADEAFKTRCFGKTWEVPIVEFCTSHNPAVLEQVRP